MKKVYSLVLFCASLLFLNACGGTSDKGNNSSEKATTNINENSSFENDVRAGGKIFCEINDLMKEGITKNKKAIINLLEQGDQFKRQMDEKYGKSLTKEKNAKIRKYLLEELQNCGLDEKGLEKLLQNIVKSGIQNP